MFFYLILFVWSVVSWSWIATIVAGNCGSYVQGRCLSNFKQVGQWCYAADPNNAVGSTAAMTSCESYGGYLAEIASPEENAAFEPWLQTCDLNVWLFIGAQYIPSVSNWQWLTDSSQTWAPWGSSDCGQRDGFICILKNGVNSIKCSSGCQNVGYVCESAIAMPVLTFTSWGWIVDPAELDKFMDDSFTTCMTISPTFGQSRDLVTSTESFSKLELQISTRNLRLKDVGCGVPFLVLTQSVNEGHMATADCKPFCGSVKRCLLTAVTEEDSPPVTGSAFSSVTAICDCQMEQCNDVIIHVDHEARLDPSIPSELCGFTLAVFA